MHENGFESEFDFGKLTISGNDEFGFRPYALLVSSVAGCSGGVLKKVLTKMRIDYDDIRIAADVKRVPEEANRVEEIKLHFTLIGNDIDGNKVEKALELSTKNCSMVQSVKGSINVIETFEIQKPQA